MVYSSTPVGRRAGSVQITELPGYRFSSMGDITQSFNVSEEVTDINGSGAKLVLPGQESFAEATLTMPWSEKAEVDVRAFVQKYKNTASNLTMTLTIGSFVQIFTRCTLVSRTIPGFEIDGTDISAKRISIVVKPGSEEAPSKVR